jgi:phosphate transport system ATP-binding protein
MDAISTEGLNLYYGDFHALKDIGLSIPPRRITALIGPSGCGKSTLLRVFNRMNDIIPGVKISGTVKILGKPIEKIDVLTLRKTVGMVFQRPNPFPFSVYENIAYGLKIHGIKRKSVIDEVVFKTLSAVGLWNIIKDKLKTNALTLPLEQQQRLCTARALATKPSIILMDEPCSALDPIATAKIEDMMQELVADYTIVIVTHNMQQAARASHYCGFMLLGELVEFGKTTDIFTSPRDKRTEDYITGRFG